MADKTKKWRETREQPGGFGAVTVEDRVTAGDKPSPDATEVDPDTVAHGWEPAGHKMPGIGA